MSVLICNTLIVFGINEVRRIILKGRIEPKSHLSQLLAIPLNNTRQKDLIKQAAIAYTKEHKVDKSVVITAADAANFKLDYSPRKAKEIK